jgi:hypothetical protein
MRNAKVTRNAKAVGADARGALAIGVCEGPEGKTG